MSSTNPFSLDWYLLQDDYAILSSGVLWTLDYLDTLPLEIDMFWTRFIPIRKQKVRDLNHGARIAEKPKNQGLGLLLMILFFVGRYFTMFYAYMRISYLQPAMVSNKYCADTSYPATVGFELAAMCTNTLLLMRAWVICAYNKLLLAVGMVVILARFAYGSYINLALEVPAAGGGQPFQPRCSWIRPDDSNDTIFQRSQSVTPALALALDTLVFVAILTPTLQLILEKRRLGLSHSKFVERFVRDGALYYVVVLTLAVCIATATFASITGTATDSLETLGQIIGPFFNLVPNILASRIVLSARAYNNSENQTAHETFVDMKFAQAAGGIGGPLASDWYNDDHSLVFDEAANTPDSEFSNDILESDQTNSGSPRSEINKDGAELYVQSVHGDPGSDMNEEWSNGDTITSTASLHAEQQV